MKSTLLISMLVLLGLSSPLQAYISGLSIDGVEQEQVRDELEIRLAPADSGQTQKEIVFIDSAVPDQATLLEGFIAVAEVIRLNSDQDGLEQIAQALTGRIGIDAIHVVSHGDDGMIRLGNTTLSIQNIEQYQRELTGIGQALSAQGDILFYGCRVAAGKNGKALIVRLAELTGTDIAASTDMTGPETQGANWQLEYAMGAIDTPLAFSTERLTGYQHTLLVTPGTIDFNNGLDSGDLIPETNGLVFNNFSTDEYGITDTAPGGDDGANVTVAEWITTSASTTKTRFYSTDGSEFKFDSVYIDDYLGVGTVTFHGYRDGVATGDVVVVSTNAGYTLHSINLNNVDEVRFTATDEFSIDDLTVSAAVNDEPTLSATGENPAFVERDPAVGLFSSSSVSTIESGQNIIQLVLTVTNVNDGVNETLGVDGSSVALTNGTAGTTGNSYNYSVAVSGTTATVTITGTLSTAATQILVNGLQYHNGATDPNTSDRVVTITSLRDSGGTANGGDDTATLNVASTVSVSLAANVPPTIGGTPAAAVGDDVPYSFTPTASDADLDPLTFSIVNKPVWANFNTLTGTLSGTPRSNNIGSTSGIVISVSDGTASTFLPAFNLQVFADLDNDNIADSVDTDRDGDGAPNISDGFPDDRRNSTDSDGDGLADEWEQYNFGDLTTADATTDSDGDGFSDLDEFNNGTDPVVAEASRSEAQRRIPPMIETLTMDEQMNAGTLYSLDWKIMGYDSSYAVIMALFDCTGIVDGSCGDNYNDANRFYSVELTAPDLTESAPWTYQGETADYFHYQTDFTVPATRADSSPWAAEGTPIVVRFYYKSSDDNAAGKTSISLMVPGNVTSNFYESTGAGRRIQKTICPAGGC